jgi:hypothetical protein
LAHYEFINNCKKPACSFRGDIEKGKNQKPENIPTIYFNYSNNAFPPFQQPVLWAIADVIFRVAFILANPSLSAIEKFVFCVFLCAPSIFLAYAVINGKFGLLAFIWPLANAVSFIVPGVIEVCQWHFIWVS